MTTAGSLVYASTEDYDPSYTQQELSCIPRYGSNIFIDSYDMTQHKSNAQLSGHQAHLC